MICSQSARLSVAIAPFKGVPFWGAKWNHTQRKGTWWHPNGTILHNVAPIWDPYF